MLPLSPRSLTHTKIPTEADAMDVILDKRSILTLIITATTGGLL
jgi:hypothetical protein